MAGRYRFTPGPAGQSTVYRFDAAAGTDTPASLWGPYTDVVLRAGGYFKADPLGALPQFRADEAVLYRKPMLGSVAIHADAVAASGVDREPDPYEPNAGALTLADAAAVFATPASVAATFGPGSDQWLKQIAKAFDFAFLTITATDAASGLPTAGTILWPDAVGGDFTGTVDASGYGYSGYVATWTGPTTKTVTVSGITYDLATGNALGPTSLVAA